ncbi:MAG: MoxR family ATPase [Chloroflexi bacterium]|nr:MoxR family ATPase [Chloroflexota bacterium]
MAQQPSEAETPQRPGDAGSSRTQSVITSVTREIGRVIVGQDELIERLLVALLTGQHALIEGAPGLAKTLTVSTLARTLKLSFSRIQFTPDLLPADITGTLVFQQSDGQFRLRRGPLFANVILADEINRAPAKVQSALLEAMQERQVTIGGTSHALPEPFFVLATQNPIEHEGTYPLPEAQLDRFMLKILVGYPDRESERSIIRRALEQEDVEVEPAASQRDLEALTLETRRIEVNERIREYIVRLLEATREPARYQLEDLEPLIEFGASPRSGAMLAQAVRSLACIRGRGYALPEDVKELAPDVLRHRLVLTYEAEARGVSPDQIVERLLAGVGIP